MARKNNMTCKTCGCCKIVYERFYFRYWRGFQYYCTACEKLIGKDGGCAHWRKRKAETDLSAQRFDSVMQDVAFLLEYLK